MIKPPKIDYLERLLAAMQNHPFGTVMLFAFLGLGVYAAK